jgi:lipoprotein-anchoring transpeptidase ErfK/SrfK
MRHRGADEHDVIMVRSLRLACLFLLVLAGTALAHDRPGKSTSLPPDRFADEAASAEFTPQTKLGRDQSPLVLRLQVLLARAHASPGVIDGFDGDNVAKAIAAFEMMAGLPVDGELDPQVWQALVGKDPRPPLMRYTLTRKDVRGPFTRTIPTDYAKMARMRRLGYRNAAEELAERFHMDLELLHQLNPHESFRRPGRDILVADIGEPARTTVTRVVADKGKRQLFAYGADGRLVSAYPATIGSEELPSPSGTHKVNAIAFNAVYWYRPDVNFKQGHNDKPLRLPPGPNNPVGSVWIDLTEPTYGIHGTPDPSKIDKTNSHGCVRLTNWDAVELAKLVKKGVPVEFVE